MPNLTGQLSNSFIIKQNQKYNKSLNKATNQIQPCQIRILNNLNLTQNLILKNHFNQTHLLEENKSRMQAQLVGSFVMGSLEWKHSQITCHSSNENSPNSEQNVHGENAPRSVRSLPTQTISLMSQQTPEKTISKVEVSSLSTYQKRSYSENDVKNKKLNQKKLEDNTNSRKLSMDQQHQQQNDGAVSLINQIIKCDQQSNCLIINEGKIQKQLSHPSQDFENKNNKKTIQTNKITINQQKTQTKIQTKSQIQINSNKETTTVDRPLPEYKDARAALYLWVRSLCFQLGVCYDVFALSMKYLDEYHITHRNAYSRSNFAENAYGLIIIASKFANKQVLTPKRIAQKLDKKRQYFQGIQIKLLKMMKYEVFFQTFAKKLQRKLQKWEKFFQQKQLVEQFSFFQQNFPSFKRFYSLIRQIQILAKNNLEVNEQMLLNVFIKLLSSQNNARGQKFLLTTVLSQLFDVTILGNPQHYNFQTILNQLNKQMDCEEDQTQFNQQVHRAFKRRNNKKMHPSYNLFLNSIFEIVF